MKTNPDNQPIIEIDEANFESEVLRWRDPVLVGFSAAWSRPVATTILLWAKLSLRSPS